MPRFEPSAGATAAPSDPGDPAARSGSRRRRGRGVPALVWALVGVNIALMLSFTMLYPAMYGYDEPQHIDIAYAYSQGHGPYDPGERRLAAGIRNGERGAGYPPTRPFNDVAGVPRDQRRSFDAQGGDTPYTAGLPNQMVQHPPLYYLAGAAVLDFPGVSGMGYDRQIWLLRLLSVLMVAPLPLLAWAAAQVLLGPGPPALVAAALTVSVPGLTRIGATVTNDALMVLVGGLLVYFCAKVTTGDRRARTGALMGLTLLVGLLTKGFALVLPPVAAAAYLVAVLRYRKVPVAAMAWVVGLCAAGGLWWLRNLVRYGAIQPLGVGPENAETIRGPLRPGGTLTGFVPGFTERISSRTWGGIGLPEGPKLTPVVTTSWMVALLVLVAAGLLIGVRGRWDRAALAVLLLPALLTLGLVFSAAYANYRTHLDVYLGVHGRYLYVGLAGLAVAFGAGLTGLVRLAGRRGDAAARWLPLAVLVAALATQVVAVRTLVGAWWTAGDAGGAWSELGDALSSIVRWSPFPAGPTYAPFVLTLVLAPAALVLAAAAGRSAPGTPAPAAEPVRDRTAAPLPG